MNILYYIPEIGQSYGGARQYSISLLAILANDQSGNQYNILHNTNDVLILDIINQHHHIHLIPYSVSKETIIENFLKNVIKAINLFAKKCRSSFQLKEYFYLDRICKKYKIDIVHCPYQYTPLTTIAKKICTMHDVQELHFPEYFTPLQRKDRAVENMRSLFSADKIIVSYDHIKQDLIKYFRLPPAKISVCLLDMQNLWFAKLTGGVIKDISNLNLPDTFLLYPANTWKHKNHLNLLETIAYLRDNKNVHVNLVCTGDKNVHFFENIAPKLVELKLQDRVFFLGIVNEEILYALYHKSVGLVIPTIYEAGSFPLMESMIMNIPVICSNVTSLPETIGDPQFLFDPFNINDMADKCYKLYTNEDYRNKNVENSKNNCKKILNTGALDIVLKMYNTLGS